LKVLKRGEVPPYVRNGTIHETFVEATPPLPISFNVQEWEAFKRDWLRILDMRLDPVGKRDEVPFDAADLGRFRHEGADYASSDFTSQVGVRLRVWSIFGEEEVKDSRTLRVVVLDQTAWESGLGDFLKGIENGKVAPLDRVKEPWRGIIEQRTGPLLFVAPRGVGPSAWPTNKDVQIRRRFALLGQTLDGMRVLDVLRGVDSVGVDDALPLNFTAVGQSAPLALLAAVLSEKQVKSVTLIDPPTTWRDGPAFLGIDRLMGMPQAAAMLHPHPLTLIGTNRESWAWTSDLSRKLTLGPEWPSFLARPAR
jgi:hypothetical protein